MTGPLLNNVFAIQPFINYPIVKRDSLKKRTKDVGVDNATLYRWIERFRNWHEVLALIPRESWYR